MSVDLDELKARALEALHFVQCIGARNNCPHCCFEVSPDEVISLVDRFHEFVALVREYDPRTDIYANDLHGEACKAIGLCPCCGEKECTETVVTDE